jgi:RNA 2',3'-cyclic 3'-phosphodiesterase
VRAFIAIRTPPIEGGADLDHFPGVANHLTLRFLGEVEERLAEVIGSALDPALAPISPFDLQLAGVGAFPSPERPRVVWAGVSVGSRETATLAHLVEGVLAPLGFPREGRAFVPHVTLLRIRTSLDRRRAEVLLTSGAKVGSPVLRVTEVLVQKSTLTRTGAVHETLHRSPLGGPDPSSGLDSEDR